VSWGLFLFLATLGLLVLVFIPGIGSTLNTAAHSWLVFGSHSIQPAEFAKFTLAIFLAGLLEAHRGDLGNIRGFLAVFGIAAIPLILILLQPDVGTALVIFSIIFGMLYAGGARWSHLAALAAVGIIAFILLIAIAPYRAARFTTFLHPELSPLGEGYQVNQAYIAIGSGGFWGMGLGHSRQKFQYLPEVHGDSIFAVLAEEMGLLLSYGFLALLGVIAYRTMRIAELSGEGAGRFLAAGILIWLLTQSFFNIGAMVGLLPLTGLPLPFVSHGGTALMMGLASAGVLVNISKHTES
jgi:cell division protein FtsW